MSKVKGFCPPWKWWIESGERAMLGIALRRLLSPGSIKGTLNRHGLELIIKGLDEGWTLVVAMKTAGMQLPAEAWCLLETSEHTGRLGEGMQEVGAILQARQERIREILGQVWYPGLILIVGVAVMGLILLWVIPQMREVNQGMGLNGRMPWLTENIGLLYATVLGSLAGSMACMCMACFFLGMMGRYRVNWARAEEAVYGKIPVIGKIRYRLRESAILRQLAILLKGGVTLPAALEMAADSVSSKWVQKELEDYRSRLLLGSSFREALEACRIIREDDRSLLLAGQECGKLETYMERISRDLERQTTWTLANATRMLEPAMLLSLTIGVGGLILAYLLPMIRMLEQAGSTF